MTVHSYIDIWSMTLTNPQSRVSAILSSNSRPSSSHQQTATQLVAPRDSASQVAGYLSDKPHHYSTRPVSSYRSSAVSAHPLDDASRKKYFSATAKSVSGVRSVIGRHDDWPDASQFPSQRASPNDNGHHLFPPSRLSTTRGSRMVSASDALDRPRYADPPMTESSISTTGPSTVWDELEDLKSRIKKLEVTGKLPPSHAASAERPPTATTAATTMSSSPRQGNNSGSPIDSAIGGIPASVHPLLHEALGKAKPVVSKDIYRKLEATAIDALQLVSISSGGGGSTIGGTSSFERQIRRRADSMCRGLTELAITLSTEQQTSASAVRPPSRDPTSSLNHIPVSRFANRRTSNDPEDLPPIETRVQSRLEGRRTSQLHTSNTGLSSPETAMHTPPQTASYSQGPSPSRLSSTSRLLRGRYRRQVDGADDVDETGSAVRPVSRAMTDVPNSRFSIRDRMQFSRDYTKQHPMPIQPERFINSYQSPSVIGISPSIRPRHSYGTTGSVISATDSVITPLEKLRSESRRYSALRAEKESSTEPDSLESTPENVTIDRGGTRRSLGLASRIGSSVGSRLRAVKAERSGRGRDQVKSSPGPVNTGGDLQSLASGAA